MARNPGPGQRDPPGPGPVGPGKRRGRPSDGVHGEPMGGIGGACGPRPESGAWYPSRYYSGLRHPGRIGDEIRCNCATEPLELTIQTTWAPYAGECFSVTGLDFHRLLPLPLKQLLQNAIVLIFGG